MTKKQFKFSIIAGSLKGKSITAPDLGITRPPLSRLRKSIFDFLMPYIDEAAYLDLFSGTGSYLFEAVSRNASSATGVELERMLADSINNQAKKMGVSGNLSCLCNDVFEAIPNLKLRDRKYDVIMIAPPQYVGLIDRTLLLLKENNLLISEGIILCQHDTSETKKINFSGFEILQVRKYGNTTFTILSS